LSFPFNKAAEFFAKEREQMMRQPGSSLFSLYWHTLRHLKPVQFWGRFWRKLKVVRADMRPAPKMRARIGVWHQAVQPISSMIAPFSFRFLNKEGCVHTPSDWNASRREKLWLYNLHYFDDLRAVNARKRTDGHKALIECWIRDNPPGHGNGWEPYPLSIRIVNWIRWGLAGNELTPEWQHSLAIQCRYLRRSIEWHLLGNHLLANAKALVFAGLFFEGSQADEWRTKGLAILGKQLDEQILQDGGHFELSPMYHSIILEDLLDLINLSKACPQGIPATTRNDWEEIVARMRYWLAVMSHPDGQIGFFNDAAFGIAASPAVLEDYARRLGLEAAIVPSNGVTHLELSGYIRVQQGDVVALLDVAPIGPDYLPGHAHADTLSFELSLSGQRVIVNGGTSLYGIGPERQWQRSTPAHSTLEIDGENSSEVWGGFRVARRASPQNLEIIQQDKELVIRCSHDGYQRLVNKNTVTRIWRFKPGALTVVDEIKGDFDQAVARYHLHPDVGVKLTDNEGTLSFSGEKYMKFSVGEGAANMISGTWHPAFGIKNKNHCIEIKLLAKREEIVFKWESNQ
jgi:uncharacterized heparinase superfamily protein